MKSVGERRKGLGGEYGKFPEKRQDTFHFLGFADYRHIPGYVALFELQRPEGVGPGECEGVISDGSFSNGKKGRFLFRRDKGTGGIDVTVPGLQGSAARRDETGNSRFRPCAKGVSTGHLPGNGRWRDVRMGDRSGLC